MIRTDPLARAAAALGMSSGGLYTVAIGMILATALTLTGPPAAFSERAASTQGLGAVAAPTPVAVAPAPPAVSSTPASPGLAATGASPGATPTPAPAIQPGGSPATTEPRRAFGGPLTTTDIPGQVRGVVAIDGGALVTVDRGAADPLVSRVDDDGEVVSSVVITGRALAGDVDISGLDVTAAGNVLVLVHGPAALLELDPASGEASTRAAIPDVPPCPVALPIPVRCEPGIVDHAPSPVDVAMVGDTILVSDPAQGALWRIAADGTVELAASSATYQASETSTGLRGLAARNDRAVLATVGETLVDIVIGTGELTTATVGELAGPGLALAIGRSGTSYALVDGGRVEVRDARFVRTDDLSQAGATAVGAAGALWLVGTGETSSTLVQRSIASTEER